MPRDWFFLYRPALPSARAQSVQLVHAAHALAEAGHRATLLGEGSAARSAILEYYGLPDTADLTIAALSMGRSLASIRYRAAFARWVLRTEGGGIALARNLRHAQWALRWFRGRFHLVYEAHEVAREADRALEALVLRSCAGIICNAEGTHEILAERHGALVPTAVVHNAAKPARTGATEGRGVGIVGSVRPYKDPKTVAAASLRLSMPITWVGADELVGGAVRSEPPIPSHQVPARLQRFRTLLLPLSPGAFGEKLTSPLKLWDALASGVPLVAADTRAVALAAPGCYLPYRPGDPDALAEALLRVDRDEALRSSLVAAARASARTWAQRAQEIASFVGALIP